MPNAGQLEAWHVASTRSGETKAVRFPVNSVEDACERLRAIRSSQTVSPLYTSFASGLEAFDGQEWAQWRDTEGRGVMDYYEDLDIEGA